LSVIISDSDSFLECASAQAASSAVSKKFLVSRLRQRVSQTLGVDRLKFFLQLDDFALVGFGALLQFPVGALHFFGGMYDDEAHPSFSLNSTRLLV
jgi:hypothetical protein